MNVETDPSSSSQYIQSLTTLNVDEILGVKDASKPEISTREAFGKALRYFGEKDPNIVVLDADLSKSTHTAHFAMTYPERFFNVGIAEQDMVSVAAGLASCGKIVVVSTFAIFLVGRALDQIRNMVALNRLNVKLVGTHAGLATGEDGATHQSLEDIAIMRSIPNMKVFSPADAIETIHMVREMLTCPDPVYLRLSRPKIPIFAPEIRQEITSALETTEDITTSQQTCSNLHLNSIEFIQNSSSDPSSSQCAIFATGIMVHIALKVQQSLENHEFNCKVVNVSTIKPLDPLPIERVNRQVRYLFSLEDHNVIGGLGTAISEVLASIPNSKPLMRIGVKDIFGASAPYSDLFEAFGLSPEQVTKKILGIMNEHDRHET